MIKLTGINKIYRTNEIETVALENVNLEVNKGEFLSIMGPSGCGKSTLLNIMGLLDAPTGGTIEIAGIKVDGMKDRELAAFRNRKLGFVFQSFHLINSLNVLDNVELPLLYRKVSAKERRRLAEEVLQKVGLSHRMRHMPTQLSGGQCQRVAIARAIIGNPEIILARSTPESGKHSPSWSGGRLAASSSPPVSCSPNTALHPASFITDPFTVKSVSPPDSKAVVTSFTHLPEKASSIRPATSS